MKKKSLLALGAAFLMGGCSDDTNNNVMDMGQKLVKVSGFTLDIDKLAGTLAMNGGPDAPTISAGDLIAGSVVPSTPVYALYEDLTQSETVMADAMGQFSLMVKANSKVQMVAAKTSTVLSTLTNEPTMVGTADLSGIPAHVCTSLPYSGPSGVAKVMGIAADALADQGVCMFGTDAHFTPPFAKENPSMASVDQGFELYAYTNPMTMPPTFVKQDMSPIGVFGTTKAGLPAKMKTVVTITATATMGTDTYAPHKCDVIPGYVTFGPISPK